MDDRGPADNIGQERVVEMAIVIVNAASGFHIRVGDVPSVEQLKPQALPMRLHLIRFEESKGAEKSASVKFGQFLAAEEIAVRHRLTRLILLHHTASHSSVRQSPGIPILINFRKSHLISPGV
jgi:hypothetical protein